MFDHCPGLCSPSAGGALDVVRPFRLQPINRAAVNHIKVESLHGQWPRSINLMRFPKSPGAPASMRQDTHDCLQMSNGQFRFACATCALPIIRLFGKPKRYTHSKNVLLGNLKCSCVVASKIIMWKVTNGGRSTQIKDLRVKQQIPL